jgi:hypothetical protein
VKDYVRAAKIGGREIVDAASKMRIPEGRARNREAKAAWIAENLTDAVISLRGGGSDGAMTRTC